jgi:ATP-dependent DNA helicase HFM1/MER3
MSNVIANSDNNVIVSSPTGSGKTALFEMAMCRLFASNPAPGNRVVSNTKKVVYIAPNKALCEERQADWSKRLMEIDPTIVCTTITGDANAAASSYGEIASANLILTTPEKWDSITRRWTEYVVLLGSIKLVVLDEVHMIGEPERGSCLEAVIGRIKTIQRAATARKLSNSEIESSR